jgi:DNA-binding transcriptional LysR family regulator
MPPLTPPEHCLLAFEALVRQGSIAAAAKELGVSRSALHRSVGLLEHLLRCTMFKTTAPEVTLTEAGSAYFASVRTFIRHVQEQLSRIQSASRVSLRIATCPAIARFLLVPSLPQLKDSAPQVDLEIAVTSLDEQGAWSTHYDAVLWYGFRPNAPGDVKALWPGNSVSYAAPKVRLQADLPQICWSVGEVAAAKSRSNGRLLVASDLTVALEMAAGGAGYVDCPSELGGAYVRLGRLVPVSSSVPDPRALYMVRGFDPATPLSRELTQWLVSSLQQSLAPS